MEKKRQIALNKAFNLCIMLGIIIGYSSVLIFMQEDIKIGLVWSAIAALLLLVPIIAAPCCYIFDSKGVTLCYIFLPNERYLWNNIRSITIESDDHRHIPFFSNVFRIVGSVEGKQRHYMDGKIRKSFRTKRLLEKYWDGTITGYFFEDIKNWWNKRKERKNKKARTSKHYLTDEVSAMERKARDKTRNFLKPLVDRAAYQGFELKPSFCYVAGNEILATRPPKNYTYSAIVVITYPDKQGERCMVDISTDLVYVHLGKSAYRGVKNENALKELEVYITDTLKEIEKNGSF